jgi:hypothetical protein
MAGDSVAIPRFRQGVALGHSARAPLGQPQLPTLELPGLEAAHVEMVATPSGVEAVTGKFSLQLELIATHGRVADRAAGAFARSSPCRHRVLSRQLSTLNRGAHSRAQQRIVLAHRCSTRVLDAHHDNVKPVPADCSIRLLSRLLREGAAPGPRTVRAGAWRPPGLRSGWDTEHAGVVSVRDHNRMVEPARACGRAARAEDATGVHT